jgi:hypothetical protein
MADQLSIVEESLSPGPSECTPDGHSQEYEGTVQKGESISHGGGGKAKKSDNNNTKAQKLWRKIKYLKYCIPYVQPPPERFVGTPWMNESGHGPLGVLDTSLFENMPAGNSNGFKDRGRDSLTLIQVPRSWPQMPVGNSDATTTLIFPT